MHSSIPVNASNSEFGDRDDLEDLDDTHYLDDRDYLDVLDDIDDSVRRIEPERQLYEEWRENKYGSLSLDAPSRKDFPEEHKMWKVRNLERAKWYKTYAAYILSLGGKFIMRTGRGVNLLSVYQQHMQIAILAGHFPLTSISTIHQTNKKVCV